MDSLKYEKPSFIREVKQNKKFYLLLVGIMVLSYIVLWVMSFIFDMGEEAEAILQGSPLLMLINGRFTLAGIVNFVGFSIFCDYAVEKLFNIFLFLNGRKRDDFTYQRPISVMLVPLKCILFTFVSIYVPEPNIVAFLKNVASQVKNGGGDVISVIFATLLIVWALRLAAMAIIYLAEYFVVSLISSVISLAALIGIGTIFSGVRFKNPDGIISRDFVVFLIMMVCYYLVESVINIKLFEKRQEQIQGFAKRAVLTVAKDFLVFTVVGWFLFGGCIDMAVHNLKPIKEVAGVFYGVEMDENKRLKFNFRNFGNHLIVSVIYNLTVIVLPVLFILFLLFAIGKMFIPVYLSLIIAVAILIGGMYLRTAMLGIYIEMFNFPNDNWKTCFKKARIGFLKTERINSENKFKYFIKCFKKIGGLIRMIWRWDIKVMLSSFVGAYPWVYGKYRQEMFEMIIEKHTINSSSNIDEIENVSV